MNSKVKNAKVMQVLTAMLVATILMLSQVSCNQTVKDTEKQQTENQTTPEFIGEDGCIMEYLGYNLEYPEEAIKAGVNIRVFYDFVVEEDGSVSDIKWVTTHIERDGQNPDVIASQKACEKVAYAIIESTSKQWKPAKKDNLPVKAEMSLPIWFKFH